MRFIYILFLLVQFSCQTNKMSSINYIEKIHLIDEMPYIPNLSGDSFYWEIVKEGLDLIPKLIEILPDTTSTNAVVPNIGGNYAVGDIAYFCINGIITNIPTKEFIPETENQNGYWFYWNFVRESQENRSQFQQRVSSWFNLNKKNLIWKEDKNEQNVAKNWSYKSNMHPAGGYYILNK